MTMATGGSTKATGMHMNRHHQTTAGIKKLSAVVFVALLWAQVSKAELPALRAPLPTTQATIAQFRAHLPGSGTTGPATNDAEIQELARGLKWDPGLMYKFVHDHIHFTPMWGEVKGPYMTWMDRSGNAFDQASLMIALLTNANGHGHTITNIKYQVGQIDVTGEQFCAWFNIINDVDTAKALLARGGFYADITPTGNDIATARLVHVWVKATIDGTNYEFDPSFKSHTRTDGIGDYNLEWAMSYDEEAFLSDAQPSTDRYSKSNIRSHLSTYTTNLINYIKTTESLKVNDDIRAIVGYQAIDPVEETTMPPALPYTVYAREQDFAISSIPNIYRTTLRIQHQGIDQTLYSSDIYGRRLSLKYNGSNQPQLILDGTVKATGTASTPGTAYDLTLTVDHPYETTSFDSTVTLKVTAGGFYHVVNGWGATDTKILLKHRGLLQKYRLDGYADSSEEVLGETYAVVGLTYLAETSRMEDMIGNISNFFVVNHHMLGIAGQYTAPYLDMALGHLGISHFGYGTWPYTEATFRTIAGHASAYEQEVIRKLQNANALSTPRLLEIASDRGTYNRVFTATSANWASIQGQLYNWSQGEKDQVTAYVNAGCAVGVPEYGDLSESNWTGIGFRAESSTTSLLTAAHIIGGGYSGGVSSGNTAISPAAVLDTSFGANTDGDPEGAYTSGATDLTIGSGSYPFGLSFARQYSSHRRQKDGPLGLGWTHNLDITAKVASDAFEVLGVDSATDAAAHLVSLYVAYHIQQNSGHGTTANLCESWLMDQMKDNVVDIRQGGSVMRFTKRPDGTYHAPPGQALKLTTNSGNFRLKNSKGIFYDFNAGGQLSQWSDAYGNVVDFTYTSGNLTGVAAKIGGSTTTRSLTLTYTGSHITSVTDSASRSISYQYSGNGELTRYSNPDGNNVNYSYDSTNKGQLWKIFSPVDVVNPFTTVVYDTIGRSQQVIDANNSTWDYYRATYRTESLPPAQADPNNQVKRFGTWSWVNPDTREATSKDQLGRITTSAYDAQGRIEDVLYPAGTSSAYEYDPNGNVLQAESIAIPDSGIADLTWSHAYTNYENASGRWFIHQKRQTNALGDVTYFYYDYNEPSPPSYVGKLLKVVHPAAGGPTDANIPIEQYTYNSYGQMLTKTDPNGMVTKYEYFAVTDAGRAGLKKLIVDYAASGHLNLTTEYTYDSVGRVATIKDPRGNTSEKQYYASGWLKKVIGAPCCGGDESYEYYADGKLKYKKKQTPTGWVYMQALTYNSRGLKATTRGPYPAGATAEQLQVNYTQYAYDALGRLWKVTDAEGHITTTRYYPDGKVWKTIDSENHTTVTNTYYGDGSLKQVKDADNNITQYTYNGAMALDTTTYPDSSYEQLTYDNYRRVTQRLGRSGQTITLTYDRLGRVTSKTAEDPNHLSSTITYKYDLLGRLYKTIDNSGTTKYTYDKGGRLIRVQYPGSMTISYQYDAGGNRTRLTYPDSTYVTHEYDTLNRMTYVRDQAGTALAHYTYDALNRRSDLDYANGAYVDYSYDTAGRTLYVDNRTNNGQHKYAYTYDYVGNRTTMIVTDGSGVRTTGYSYDSTYQLTAVDYPDSMNYLATDTTFNYDAAGNRTSVIDGSGTTPYVTNSLNQYSSADGTYFKNDTSGNMTYDGQNLYSYDPENRLTKVKKFKQGPSALSLATDTDLVFTTGGSANWTAQSTGGYFEADCAKSGTIGNNQESWLQTTTSGPGTLTFYWRVSSDGGDYLRFYVDGVEDGTPIAGEQGWAQRSYTTYASGTHTFKWSYVKNSVGSSGSDCGWVDRVVWTPSWTTRTLADALDSFLTYTTGGNSNWRTSGGGQLDSDCAATSLDSEQESWLQTTVTGPGTLKFWWTASVGNGYAELEFRIDGAPRSSISSQSWEEKTYTITGTGPHTLYWRYSTSSDSSGSCSVDYVRWTGPLPQDPPADAWRNLTYTYDASGRRIAKSYDGVTVLKYIYDGDSCIAEYDANGNLRRKYVYGPSIDQPVCMVENTVSPAATYYYHFDGSGNVVALTNSSGNTVEVYEYDAYGKVGASDQSHPNRFLFTGRELDKETGLYYYRARYYKAEIGRFLQADEVGYAAGMNLYRYCLNNPWNVVDPLGKDPNAEPCEPCGCSPDPNNNSKPATPDEPNAPFTCPPREDGATAAAGAGLVCKDTEAGQSMHQTRAKRNCYREIVPNAAHGGVWGKDKGEHCCYWAEGDKKGQLDRRQSDTDNFQVSTKTTGDAEHHCDYTADIGRGIQHVVFDLIPSIPCKLIGALVGGRTAE